MNLFYYYNYKQNQLLNINIHLLNIRFVKHI